MSASILIVEDEYAVARGIQYALQQEGYEVSVVLEATIGFSRTERPDAAQAPAFDVRVEKAEPLPLKMTPLDKKFLRSLKISIEGEEE